MNGFFNLNVYEYVLLLEWSYENPMGAPTTSGETPKLEDFFNSQPPQNEAGAGFSITANNQVLGFPAVDRESANQLTHSLQSSQQPYHGLATPPCYHPPAAGITSVSCLKSWLRQAAPPTTPFPAETPVSGGGCSYQPLSLSVSQGAEGGWGGAVAAPAPATTVVGEKRSGVDYKSPVAAAERPEAVPRKSIDTFGQRTSQYRGVTR